MKISSNNLYKFILFTLPIRFLVIWLIRMIIFFRKTKIILVFGLSRSGTTMLGTFLSFSPYAIYIHEPEKEFLELRYQQKKQHTPEIEEFWKYSLSEEPKRFKAHSLACLLLRTLLETPRNIKTICIKPIYLTDVMEEATYGLNLADIIYISRHPCGRSESILRQNKHHNNIDLSKNSIEILEILGLEWGRTTKHILDLFLKYPDWHWVLFEELANNPLQEFKKLYIRLGLSWTSQAEEEIRQLTNGEDGGFYDVKRNSQMQADKWRNALTEDQIEAVRKKCLPYETNLYDSF